MILPLSDPPSIQQTSQGFQFGPLHIYPNVNLSSMHGVSDLAFRSFISHLCGGQTGWLITEFVSAAELVRHNPRSLNQLRYLERERPFGVQIYGGDPGEMAEAAKMVEGRGVDYIEINCGCPAPKVVRRQCGSGLLLDLDHYREVVAAVRGAISVPLSVKVRIGYFNGSINVIDTLRIAEQEGVQMFIIHGRTREQRYNGLADWDIIKWAKSEASIPVIGNGDVLTLNDVLHKFRHAGVDGISVGRGALHNPWLFKQVLDHYEGRPVQIPTLQDQVSGVQYYYGQLLESYENPGAILGKLKQLASRMLKGYPLGNDDRKQVLRSGQAAEFFERFGAFAEKWAGQVRDPWENIPHLN